MVLHSSKMWPVVVVNAVARNTSVVDPSCPYTLGGPWFVAYVSCFVERSNFKIIWPSNMVGSPLGRKCSKKDAQILKENSSHALSIKVLRGKRTESTPKSRSTETRNRSSFSSLTISSSGKINTETQKGKSKFPFFSFILDGEQYTLIKHDFFYFFSDLLICSFSHEAFLYHSRWHLLVFF